jgi:hypothetical protein
LYEGRQIFFGSKDHAKEYFTDMGYLCPDRQTTADFLTSLTNPSERKVQPGFEKRVPRTPDEFANAWKHSEARAQLVRDINAFEHDSVIENDYAEKLKAVRKSQQASFTYVSVSNEKNKNTDSAIGVTNPHIRCRYQCRSSCALLGASSVSKVISYSSS